MLTGSPSNVHPSHFQEEVADPSLPLDAERDLLLSRRDDRSGFDPEDLPELRWKNLRRIMMRRKGLRI